MTDPDFWNDNIAAQKTSQELNELKQKFETFHNMQELSDETELYLEMLEEDDSVKDDLEDSLEKLDRIMTSYEMTLLLSEPYDHNNAILEIHPGSGGTEAQDWADMLLRMYTRYGNAKGFKVSPSRQLMVSIRTAQATRYTAPQHKSTSDQPMVSARRCVSLVRRDMRYPTGIRS